MPKPTRVLLVVESFRPDSFDYLIRNGGSDFEWVILWDYKTEKKEFSPGIPFISWSDYSTPDDLIDSVKPDKIIFLVIIDLWEIPLIVHAKKRNITTFFISHGIRDKESDIKNFEFDSRKKTLALYFSKITSSFSRVIKNRFFYYSCIMDLNSISSALKYFFLPFRLMFQDTGKVLMANKFAERGPDYAFLFCENNVPSYELYHPLLPGRCVKSGFPFFDKFYLPQEVEDDYLVFIEHPYLELGLLKWDDNFHRKTAQNLYDFSRSRNIRIVVKLHPRSNIQNWKRYNFPEENIEIIQSEVPESLYLKAKLILGYSSTLTIAFLCARKNVVLLGWHPTPQIYGANFAETGLCHESFDMTDLHTKYDSWVANNMSLKNEKEYDAFLKRYNYPFDGKATQRILDTIKNV